MRHAPTPSESSEIAPTRRNLLAITSILMLIQISGATIKSINAPAVTIEFQHPEIIIYFLYSSLFYFLHRFWLLANPHYKKYSSITYDFLTKSKYIITTVENAINIENIGIKAEDIHKIYRLTYLNFSMSFFKRKLIINITNSNSGSKSITINLSLLGKLLSCEITSHIKAVLKNKDFIEFSFPFLYAYFVILLKIISLVYIYY